MANFIIGTIDPKNSFFQGDDDDDVVKNDVDHFCNRSMQYFIKCMGNWYLVGFLLYKEIADNVAPSLL